MAHGRFASKRKNFTAELQKRLGEERKETEKLRGMVEMLLKQNTELLEEIDRIQNRPTRNHVLRAVWPAGWPGDL